MPHDRAWIWWLVAMSPGWIHRSALALETCAPAASLSPGARGEAVSRVRRSLAERGIAETSPPGCPRLEVEIWVADAGFDLRITDADGRTARRRVRSAETAATLIESWARPDLSAPLLAVRLPSEQLPLASPAPEPPPADPSDARPAAAPSLARAGSSEAAAATKERPPAAAARVTERPPGTSRSALLIGVAPETSLAIDRSPWLGAGAGVCARLGPVCAGVAGRYARSLQAGAGPPGWTRLETFDLMAKVEAPLALGGVRLLPGVGLGFGRALGSWRSRPRETPPAGQDPFGTGLNGNGGDGAAPGSSFNPARGAAMAVSTSRTEDLLRATAGVGVLVPIAGALSLEVAVSGGVSLLELGAATSNAFPAGATVGAAPAIPRAHLAGALGLRYGRP